MNRLREWRRALAPALCWQPAAVLGALAVAVVVAGRLGVLGGDPTTSLRLAALLIAAGAAFAFDDASAALTDAVPPTRRLRAAARIGAVGGLAAAAWAAALVSAAAGRPEVTASSAAGLSIEAAALLVLGLAVAAVLRHRAGMAEPGAAAGPAAGLLAAPLLLLLPDRIALLVPPGPDWADAHLRWLVLLVAATTVLAWVTADPARRRPFTR